MRKLYAAAEAAALLALAATAVPAVASARQPASPGTFDKAVTSGARLRRLGGNRGRDRQRAERPSGGHTLDILGPLTIADLTGNGRSDLVIAHGGWTAVGDLNGDGRPDIAVAAGADVAVLYQK